MEQSPDIANMFVLLGGLLYIFVVCIVAGVVYKSLSNRGK